MTKEQEMVFVPMGKSPDDETRAKIKSGEFVCVMATTGGINPNGRIQAGVWYGPKKPVN